MVSLEKVLKSYKRFLTYWEGKNGIYIYPEFVEDLEVLLEFVAVEAYGMKESDKDVCNIDCSWK